jgi:CheY-like chemotaxis protein
MRVILVEDHEDTRRGLAALLRVTGHFVTDVAGADDALAVLSSGRGRYDCAIIDLSLPPGDSDRIAIAAAQANVSHCVALGELHGGNSNGDSEATESGTDLCRTDGRARLPFSARLGKPVVVEELNRVLRHLGRANGRPSERNPAL